MDDPDESGDHNRLDRTEDYPDDRDESEILQATIWKPLSDDRGDQNLSKRLELFLPDLLHPSSDPAIYVNDRTLHSFRKSRRLYGNLVNC